MSLIKLHYDIVKPEDFENFPTSICVFIKTLEQKNSKLDEMSKTTLD